MTPVDPRSVMVVIILGELMISIGLFALSRGRLSETGTLSRWAVATLMHATGWIFFGLLRGIVPDLISILVGNALLLLALGLYVTIVASLTERPASPTWIYGLVALTSLVLAHFTLVTPNVAARIAAASACGAVLMLWSAALLLVGRRNRPISDLLTGSMFLGNGLLLVARTVYSLVFNADPNQSPVVASPVNGALFVSFFVTGIMLHFGYLLMINDRHSLRLAEVVGSLQFAVREKEALLKEVHHRVKNNLQLVTSLMRLRASDTLNGETKAILTDMRGKIQSVIVLNETLYKTGSYDKVNLAEYLKQVATELVKVHGKPGGVRLVLGLDPVELETRQVIPCGLIVNELVTNSLKHAFPGGQSGEVRLSLGQEADGRVRLQVSDSGPGLPEGFENRLGKSLGLQLVSDLTRQLRGTLEVGPDAAFVIRFTPSTDGSGGHAIQRSVAA